MADITKHILRLETAVITAIIGVFAAFDAAALDVPDVDGNTTVSDQTISGGGEATLNINEGGSATNTTINRGGMVNVNDGGSAKTATINDGGQLNVAGGNATDVLVASGGTINALTSGSIISNVNVQDGGHFNFSTDITASGLKGASGDTASINLGEAKNFTVSQGSSLTANDGGTISDSTFSGGTATISGGGMITDSSFSDGGTLTALAPDAVVGENVVIDTESGGGFDISTSALVSNLHYGDQVMTILDNVVSGLNTLYENSRLVVDSNGRIDGLTVDGGTLAVNGGVVGETSGTNVVSGQMQVVSGSAYNTTVSGTGQVTASGNSTLHNTSIADGGEVILNDGAQSSTTTVNDGGSFTVNDTAVADNTTVGKGGLFVVNSGGTASNSVINDGGQMTADTATITGAIVNNGGKMTLSASTASDVALGDGGILESSTGTTLTNLSANAGSILNLSADTLLSGSLLMDVDVNASGSDLDFANLFTANNTLSSLTVNGGVNEAFEGKLINDPQTDKKLTLSGGNYVIFNPTGGQNGPTGTVQVSGWSTIDVASGSSVRLESDLTMGGSEQNFIINEGASLDVSGTLNNINDVLLTGNVVNNGTIDLTLADKTLTGDKLTISGNYSGGEGARLNMSVDPRNNTADGLVINGDVSGTTEIYLTAASAAVPNGNILLVDAPNNVSGTAESFGVWRYEGSPYTWETLFENNQWYTYVSDGDRPGIVPETAAYYGLIDNTLMQTASLGANLRTNIVENEFRKVPCRKNNYSKYNNSNICRSDRPVFTGWVAPVFSDAKVEAPYNYTASITGFDGGLDLIGNGKTKFGLMASYRSGTYKYEDSGESYTLKGEAETAIDSYLGGAYLRADSGAWSIIGAVYAGQLDVDISTKDNVTADTSGTTWGATLDVSYIYENIMGFRIEPGVRLSWTSVSLDEIEDNAGKRQEFDDSDRKEIEIGVRLAQRWVFPDAKAEIYAKPSIIQTMDSNSDFELVEERFLDAAEDRTLAKIEGGMLFDMIGNWSAGLKGSYAFGSDYTNATVGMNVLYNF